MPTSAETALCLVDTSVAIALCLADHDQHDATVDAVRGRPLGLAGHAAFETFSVLTRLPAPARRAPAAVSRLLARNFPQSRYLSPGAAARLLADLGDHAIAGGSVYDALVAATAHENDARLVTRDRRALEVYQRLGVDVELLPGA